MNWLGDYPEDFTTVAIYFTTHDVTGAPVAPLTGYEAADVTIYKNGSATQKTSTNGVTMTSPFDSITGLHCVVIDTSNDTGDSGFWTTGGGGVYSVILNPDTETVAGQTTRKFLILPQDPAITGSDNRVLVSADVHTSGETVAAVTGAVGSVTGAVGSRA
jgi:hypothetical protein